MTGHLVKGVGEKDAGEDGMKKISTSFVNGERAQGDAEEAQQMKNKRPK
jgi:hypothetical protein